MTLEKAMNRRKPPPHKAGRIARALWIALLAGAVLAPSAVVSAGPSDRFFPFNAPADPQAPRISALDVVPVAQLSPGTQLRFELRGTPGAEASLRIDGARRVLGLAEVAPGQYRGIYTVGTSDRIGPDATVVGNLRRGEQLGLAMLTGPLQRHAVRPRSPA
jgi:hypothetical protein